MLSLTRRLLLLVLTAVATGVLVLGLHEYHNANALAVAIADQQLSTTTQILFTLINSELHEHYATGRDTPEALIERATFEEVMGHLHDATNINHLAYQFRIGNKLPFYRSPEAPQSPLSRAVVSGCESTQIDGTSWRVCTLQSQDRLITVQVGQRAAEREAFIRNLATSFALPSLAALTIVLLTGWLGIPKGLQPLVRLAEDIRRRDPDALEDISPGHCPAEAIPLIDALNRLIARIRHLAERERRFVAHAAHELRTPLAGLRAQLQVAQRIDNADARERAIGSAIAGVDRLTHLVSQLLALARLENDRSAVGQRVDLSAVCRDCASEFEQICAARGMGLIVDGIDDCGITGDVTMLVVLVRNLIDNALRYGNPGGTVTVRTAHCGTSATLTVSDNGPGIPAAQREEALQPFRRLANGQSAGSGLGLAIVAEIARLHRAVLSLRETAGGGLTVTIDFQPAAGDA